MRRVKLLPAEKVLAAFLVYCLARLAAAGELRFRPGTIPRADFVIVFLLVLCVRFGLDFRRTPWPEETHGQRRIHVAFLALFLLFLPLVLPPFPSLHPHAGWEGATIDLFIAIYAWTEIVLLVLAPFVLFWLASAQHIKGHGRLDTVGMVRLKWRSAVGIARDWFPLLALLYSYGFMGPVIGKGFFGDQDEGLARLDRLLFLGEDPRILCEHIISRPLSEWLSGCYVFFLPLFPLVLGSVFAKADPAPFRELCFAIVLTLAVGYVTYTFVPAQGPLFLDHFDVNLDAYIGKDLRAQLMDRTRVPRDCFPSLHTAASFTLLWGAYRHLRRLFWVLLPIVLSIPFACVYLRYHYVVDVLAGLALFGAVTTWTGRSRALQAAFHTGA